jgi:hypothetical protein
VLALRSARSVAPAETTQSSRGRCHNREIWSHEGCGAVSSSNVNRAPLLLTWMQHRAHATKTFSPVWDFCNLRAAHSAGYFVPCRPQAARLFQMMNSLTRFSWIALHWRISAVIACAAVGIAFTTRRCLETDEARVQREQRNRKKELRALANRISTYGRKVHQRYPTGDVVVSEHDLAEQLRERPDAVATALSLLLSEQKIHRAPLSGYWKLNV